MNCECFCCRGLCGCSMPCGNPDPENRDKRRERRMATLRLERQMGQMAPHASTMATAISETYRADMTRWKK